eukprot:scaffold58985_cov53-Phaeocystis_antarctica.AAC.4
MEGWGAGGPRKPGPQHRELVTFERVQLAGVAGSACMEPPRWWPRKNETILFHCCRPAASSRCLPFSGSRSTSQLRRKA